VDVVRRRWMQRNRDRHEGLSKPGSWNNGHVGVPPKVVPTKGPGRVLQHLAGTVI